MSGLPSPETLRKLLRYEPETGRLFWRDVSRSENQKNRKRNSNNTSGVTGVYASLTKGKWTARIVCHGEHIHLGTFDGKDDAIRARKDAEIAYGFHENHGRKGETP